MIKERGLNKRYMDRYNEKNGGNHFTHTVEKSKKVDPVDMKDTATTFLIITIGGISSVFFLLVENFYHFKFRFR